MSNVFNQIGFIPKTVNIVAAGTDGEVIQDFSMNEANSIGSVSDGVYPYIPVEFSFYNSITTFAGISTYHELFNYKFNWDSTINKYPPYSAIQVYFTAHAASGNNIGSRGRVGLYGMRSILGYGNNPTVANSIYNGNYTQTYTWTYAQSAASGQETFNLFNHSSTSPTIIGLLVTTSSNLVTYNFRVRSSGAQGTVGTWNIQGIATLL